MRLWSGLHSGLCGPWKDVFIRSSHSMLSSFTFLWRLPVWALHHHRVNGYSWQAGFQRLSELEAACATLGSESLSREPQASPRGISYLCCRPGYWLGPSLLDKVTPEEDS